MSWDSESRGAQGVDLHGIMGSRETRHSTNINAISESMPTISILMIIGLRQEKYAPPLILVSVRCNFLDIWREDGLWQA